MDFHQPHPDPLDPTRRIVTVPIPSSPGDSVVMLAGDYERWTREYGLRTLQLRVVGGRAYVFFRPYAAKDTCIILSRYLMGSPQGRHVFLVDGDPLNLRRNNLGCRKGGGGGMTWKRRPPKGGPAGVAADRVNSAPSRTASTRSVLRKPVVAEKVRNRGTA